MQIIDLQGSDRSHPRLAQLRLMCAMVFPDDPELRLRAEITYWTVLNIPFSGIGAEDKLSRSSAAAGLFLDALDARPKRTGEDIQRTERFLSNLLAPYGGRQDLILQLALSPSVQELNQEWRNRWWDIFYTGKILSLIGSIYQHHGQIGASLNKAIFILRETEAGSPARRFRRVCESNLLKAWAKYRPVAHLCVAYYRTECDHYKEEMARDFAEYLETPPALLSGDVFQKFLLFAKAAQDFATSYSPRGRSQPLISRDEILALDEGVIDPSCQLPKFEPLTDAQVNALNEYKAPTPSV